MGVGYYTGNKETRDFLEIQADFEPDSASERVCHAIMTHLVANRDALGYPKSCNSLPYFTCSNDLSLKFVKWAELCVEKNVPIDPNTLVCIVRDLLASYDEVASSKATCHGFFHSVSKDEFQKIIPV